MLDSLNRLLARSQNLAEVVEPLESRIAPALVVTVTDGATNTTPGSALTYTIDYANAGEDDATGVVIADTLPTGTTFDSEENPGWTLDAGVLSFGAGDLAAGADGQASLILHVAAVAPAGLASIVNTVSIARDGAQEPEATASDTTALDAAPDLTVTKTHEGAGAATPGGSLGYTIVFGNVGNQDATGVVLTEHLPAGANFDAVNSSEGWTETEGGSGIYQLVVGPVAGGGGSGTRTFAVKINDTVAAAQEQIINVVDIADDGTNGEDLTPTDNTALDTIALDAAPDLTLTKNADTPNVTPSGSVTFSFAYANAGNQNATGVSISDTLPAHTTFDSGANPGWTLNGTTLSFVIGNLAAGAQGSASLVLGVAATVPAGAVQIANDASIADDGSNGSDPTPANNLGTATVLLDAAPDLTLTKTDGATQARRGQTLSYTFGYANEGTQDATGVSITDTLPDGVSFDTGLNPGWVFDGTTLTLTIGDLAAGASGTATLMLRVDDDAPLALTQIVNSATIADDSSNGADLNPGDNTATDVNDLLAPLDLTLTKSDGVEVATPGATLTYTFDYANAGGIGASGVTITDTLPPGTAFDAGANPGWALNSGVLTFLVGDLAAGANGTATLVLTVATTAPAGLSSIVNAASITDDGSNGIEANPANNTAEDTDALEATPDLVLTKIADAPSVTPGGTVTFTFTYENTGNQDASGVVITDMLPQGTTFDGGANAGWALDGTTLTLTVGSLAVDANGTATLVLGVAAAAPAGLEQIANAASIADDGTNGADPTPANNFSSVALALDATPDLTLSKTDNLVTVMRGETVTYTFTYSNTGNQDASGVVITDALPAGTTFDGTTNPGWVFDSGNGTLTFTIGALAADGQGTTTLVLTVATPLPDGLEAITNTATIADDGASGIDPTPGNNTATDIDTLVRVVDLTLDKTSESTSVAPGGSVTYTFAFGNTGDLGATSVVLTDVLPAGTSFDAVANPGWMLDGTTLTFAVGSLAAGAQGSATLTLNVATAAPAGLEQIVNTASIADDGSNGVDFSPADNTATLNLPLDATPDLNLTKSGGGVTVVPGGTITYSFTYANAGNQHATGVVITDTLPAGTTFDASQNPGWNIDANTLSFTIGALNAGDDGIATLILKAADSAPAGQTQIVNTASITDDGTGGTDPNPNDNGATATNPLNAQFDLTLGITSTGSVAPSGTLVFTLDYANTGNQAATGVVLTENLPAGTTFNAGASTAGWVETSPGVFQFTVGSLDGGASGSVAFAVTVESPAAAGREQIVDNAALASDGTDPTPANNSAQKSVTLSAAPNLGVTLTSSESKLTAGKKVTYTITYTNTGNQNASGVVVTEKLPHGMSFVSNGSSAGWTNAGSGMFELNVGSLAVGQSVTVSFVAKVASTVTASKLTNRVSIADDATSGADSNPANNTASLVQSVRSSFSSGGIWAMADDGVVNVFSRVNGMFLYKFRPYGDDVKHVNVALADFNRDGIADIVTSSKESSKVRIYDGRTGILMNTFKPFGTVSNGLRLTVNDTNGDGMPDLLVKQRDTDGKTRVFSGTGVARGIEPIKILTFNS